ncbi:cyclase family protein [Nordella sp. HKS 07]|uniref:cyclase family protein n=1 Tax=Nordella sp. HKS 07 TaxID=2712222 RepID=UPI0019D31F27|nr:cyclase family protein [Nordella sp. HKS 07]
MTRTLTPPAPVSLKEFDALFEKVRNWGRWGPDDERGTLNYLTPDKVTAAARLVRSGRQVSMAIPISKTSGPDNPNPAVHLMSLLHDLPVSKSGLSFGMCYLGMASHGDAYTHVDALNHVGYKGKLYNGKPVSTLTSRGSDWGSITAYSAGLVGRGVMLDAARHRGVEWLEPGEAVTRSELEEIEKAQGVRLGEGDILVFRTGHHARRLKLGAWSNEYPPAGEGKAGLHIDTVPWMHERRIAAFLPDGDGETVPSNVEGMPYPIHALQLTAMGMCISDSQQLEELAVACEQEGRFEFMVVGLPLRLPGATGTPWNPIAIF